MQTIETRLCKPGHNPAVSAFLYLYLLIFKRKLPYLHVRVTSTIPVGSGTWHIESRTLHCPAHPSSLPAGLGSSAALSVCTAAALLSIKGTVNVGDSPLTATGSWQDTLRPNAQQVLS